MDTQSTEELAAQLQAKKEELVGEYHLWLQEQFQGSNNHIDSLIAHVPYDRFLEAATAWAEQTKPNQVFY